MLQELKNSLEKYNRILNEYETLNNTESEIATNYKFSKTRLKTIWIELRKTIIEFNQSL